MILVIDTNVFISGFISESYPWRILDYFLDKRFTLALDDRIYLEYSAVLRRKKFGLKKTDVDYFLDFTASAALFITPGKCDIKLIDVADLKFIETARSANADGLITGNMKHFEPAKNIIPVFSPKEAWEKLFVNNFNEQTE